MHRKSTSVLQLNGTASKNPQRLAARADELPVVGSLGDPPAHLSPEHASVWRELASVMPHGVAGAADRFGFEVLTALILEFRTKGAAGLKASLIAQLAVWCGRFGLTPSDRARVAASAKATTPASVELTRALAAVERLG
jgi:phage terminase small subunit